MPQLRSLSVVCRAASAAVAAAIVIAAFPATAQPESAVVVPSSALEWQEIVPGLEFAAVYGDWSAEGHGKMVRVASGFTSPLHRHTGDYHATVISGTVTNPYPGETEPPQMGPGASWYVPAGAPHVTACVSEEPCLFYTHSEGAWDLEVVEEPAAEAGE
jgi:quercetin dioxygenase-like cupin family protein